MSEQDEIISSISEKKNESEKSKEGEKTKGLYIDFKTRTKQTSGIFDFSDLKIKKRIKQINTFISEKRIWIVKDRNDDIMPITGQIAEGDCKILFHIRKKNEGFTIKANEKFEYNLEPSLSNIKKLNYYFWYVINSENDSEITNVPNKDYYLTEGDIIKIGHIKIIVKKIFFQDKRKSLDLNSFPQRKKKFPNDENVINLNQKKRFNSIDKNEKNANLLIDIDLAHKDDKKEEKTKEMFDLNPKYVDTKICEICGEKIFQFCKCNLNHYEHLDCFKKWLDDRKLDFYNESRTVRNYIFNIFRCDNELQELNNKKENEKCNTLYPIKFKYLYTKGEIKKDIIKDLEPIKTPKDSSYMILETLEYCDINSIKYKKSIHVIKLTGDDITIGKAGYNDIYLNNDSVCPEHAVIKYKHGKLLIKNRSKVTGTLVLIRENSILIKENKIYLQIDKTFFEAQIMEKEIFQKKIEDNNTKYPITKKEYEKNILQK